MFKRKTIPYSVLSKVAFLDMKISYDILISNSVVPNEDQLLAIATKLKSRKHTQTFVCFYLPGMKVDAGAFATGHSRSDTKVEIFEWMVSGKYTARTQPKGE